MSENTIKTQELTLSQIKELNLYEKIQLVSMEIMNIEKDMSVGSGNYSYKAVGDSSVTLAVKKAERKFRLVSIPCKQELINSKVEKTTTKNNKEALTFIDNIKMTIKIVNLDKPEEFTEIESFGKGIDSKDKGFGKASTYARKYGLLNAYKIATGQDPDSDKSKEMEQMKNPSAQMVKIKNYFNKNLNSLPQYLKHFGIQSLDELTTAQIKITYDSYSQKGLL